MSKAFISYARKDADVASRFRYRLRDGRVSVFMDEAAKDNWVWPLIADRQVALVRPERRYEDVDEIVDGLIYHPDEPSQDCRAG